MINYRTPIHSANAMDTRDNIILDGDNVTLYKCISVEDMPLAMAYVPWQQWKTVYDLNKALKIGTIFPELDLPFCGMRGEHA